MLNFNSLLIFSENPEKLVEFYGKVFEKEPDWSGGNFKGFKVGGGMITFGPHDKVSGMNSNPERMMLNFEASDVAAEFDRIKKSGATVVKEPYHPGEEVNMWIATFSDPDGNFFQLISPMKM